MDTIKLKIGDRFSGTPGDLLNESSDPKIFFDYTGWDTGSIRFIMPSRSKIITIYKGDLWNSARLKVVPLPIP